MGAGKSHIGKQLAAATGFRFFDLDAFIEAEEKQTIAGLFEKYGEIVFRNIERKYLLHTVDLKFTIIATGGGTPCYYDNIGWMNKNGITIYLETKTEILANRLIRHKAHRPLLQGLSDAEIITFIEQKLKEREEYYRKAQLIYHQKSEGQPVAQELADYIAVNKHFPNDKTNKP